MLQKLDHYTKELLDLADFIEGLEPDRFDMGSWGAWQEPRCICGWYLHNKSYIDKSDWEEAGKRLGLSRETAHDLFHHGRHTPKEAASVLRHLALTGELV